MSAAGFNLNNLKTNTSSLEGRKHDALVDFVRTLILCPGVGYQRTITPLGTLLRIKAAEGGTSPHPFKLLNASQGEQKKIRVVYGTVNSEIPTGMSEGDDPPYVLTGISGSGVVYLVVTIDGDQNVNSVTIGKGASIPSNNSTAFHLQIGSYSVNSEGKLSIAQSISGSQAFQLCGGITPLWGLV